MLYIDFKNFFCNHKILGVICAKLRTFLLIISKTLDMRHVLRDNLICIFITMEALYGGHQRFPQFY